MPECTRSQITEQSKANDLIHRSHPVNRLAPCGGGCAKNPDKEQPEQPMAAHPLCTLGAEGELPKTVVQSLLCGPRVVVKAT